MTLAVRHSVSPEQRTILLVDDEPLFLTSVEDALSARLPFARVLRAANGREALDHIRNNSVQLLVTDVRMPELDGLQLLSEMSRLKVHVPTIVATAHALAETEAHAMSLGALAIIEKPIDIDALLDLVERRLSLPDSGMLEGVSLPGFLQLLAMERQGCTVHVAGGEKSGVITFVAGQLVDARVGSLRGEEAARQMMRWQGATFHVEPTMTDVHHTVLASLDHLLLDAARQQDEAALGPSSSSAPDELTSLDLPWPRATSPESTTNEETNPERVIVMSNVTESLAAAMDIEGAIASALVDFESGMTLGTAGGGEQFDIELAASGNTQVVRSKMAVMKSLGIEGGIEDILITLDDQFHLIRPLKSVGSIFLYLAIDKQKGNLGLARHKLGVLEKQLQI